MPHNVALCTEQSRPPSRWASREPAPDLDDLLTLPTYRYLTEMHAFSQRIFRSTGPLRIQAVWICDERLSDHGDAPFSARGTQLRLRVLAWGVVTRELPRNTSRASPVLAGLYLRDRSTGALLTPGFASPCVLSGSFGYLTACDFRFVSSNMQMSSLCISR